MVGLSVSKIIVIFLEISNLFAVWMHIIPKVTLLMASGTFSVMMLMVPVKTGWLKIFMNDSDNIRPQVLNYVPKLLMQMKNRINSLPFLQWSPGKTLTVYYNQLYVHPMLPIWLAGWQFNQKTYFKFFFQDISVT